MDYILIAVACWYLGWKARERTAMRKIEQFMQDVEEDEDNSRVLVFIEEHNDQMLVYREGDSKFLTQGKTKAEVVESLSKMFPNQTVTCDESSKNILESRS
jgi:hypothetical protein